MHKQRREQLFTGGTGSWPGGAESQKVSRDAVTVGKDREGAVGNPTADHVPLTGTVKNSSGCLWGHQ